MLVFQVRVLDDECKRIRIENAGIIAKCKTMERNSSAPTPKKRHIKQEKEREELDKERELMEKEIDTLKEVSG